VHIMTSCRCKSIDILLKCNETLFRQKMKVSTNNSLLEIILHVCQSKLHMKCINDSTEQPLNVVQ
jgi:hypothetical protein